MGNKMYIGDDAFIKVKIIETNDSQTFYRIDLHGYTCWVRAEEIFLPFGEQLSRGDYKL